MQDSARVFDLAYLLLVDLKELTAEVEAFLLRGKAFPAFGVVVIRIVGRDHGSHVQETLLHLFE